MQETLHHTFTTSAVTVCGDTLELVFLLTCRIRLLLRCRVGVEGVYRDDVFRCVAGDEAVQLCLSVRRGECVRHGVRR